MQISRIAKKRTDHPCVSPESLVSLYRSCLPHEPKVKSQLVLSSKS